MVNVELPVEANLVWQLGRDLLNMYIETEVSALLTACRTDSVLTPPGVTVQMISELDKGKRMDLSA